MLREIQEFVTLAMLHIKKYLDEFKAVVHQSSMKIRYEAKSDLARNVGS